MRAFRAPANMPPRRAGDCPPYLVGGDDSLAGQPSFLPPLYPTCLKKPTRTRATLFSAASAFMFQS
ncbi:hypothetical protein SBV1_700004 [Verrucomicrobia bacterium]|nr:hypothetical protein SBV1_700004 [Verrucomicrobiota bacterium]